MLKRKTYLILLCVFTLVSAAVTTMTIVLNAYGINNIAANLIYVAVIGVCVGAECTLAAMQHIGSKKSDEGRKNAEQTKSGE